MTEIPKISDEVLEERYAKIQPLLKRDGKLFSIQRPIDLRNQSFIWDPKIGNEVKGLKEIAQVKTLHTYGYYGIFKPSIAEVLSQVPEYLLDQVVAFHLDGPDTVNDLNKFREELNMGFHVGFATFYKKASLYESIFHKSV